MTKLSILMMNDERVLALDPAKDGITHINIYTKGATRLGRLLTNLADVPVVHPTYGRFRTAEGLWYYLKTGMKHEDLRAMDGFAAKTAGRSLETVWLHTFEEEFMLGLINKVSNHPELLTLFTESTLSFEHYYYYPSKNRLTLEEATTLTEVQKIQRQYKVVEPREGGWMTEFFTEMRKGLKGNS